MMAGAFMTTALADSYQIWVGGMQVTDDNKSNISPSGKTAGTITFDGSALTFTGVTMSSTGSTIQGNITFTTPAAFSAAVTTTRVLVFMTWSGSVTMQVLEFKNGD